jgi:glycosyltransferase involved in cell wall biosynthesis
MVEGNSQLPHLNHIGIVSQTSAGWAAAASYTRMLMHSLSAACDGSGVHISLLSVEEQASAPAGVPAVDVLRPSGPGELPGERAVRKILRLPQKSSQFRGEARLRHIFRIPDPSDIFATARVNNVDVLLPVFDLPPWNLGVRTIGWVPDFQHVGLAHLFSDEELQRRDASIHRLAEKANLIMLSSKSAQNDFAAFAPAAVSKTRVIPFPSLLAFLPFPEEPVEASRERYHLPEKFALVANQFWSHKNHMLVVEAVAQLKRRGIIVPVVMTGMTADHRDPSGKHMSNLLQAIARNGLTGQVIILGMVPFSDLINLMRSAAVIIQPSRFEGWSTVVQDAKAIGRPLLCSDISVHLEQAPESLGFFSCDDPDQLADLLAESWSNLSPGPSPACESRALETERAFARNHGANLLNVCREAMS